MGFEVSAICFHLAIHFTWTILDLCMGPNLSNSSLLFQRPSQSEANGHDACTLIMWIWAWQRWSIKFMTTGRMMRNCYNLFSKIFYLLMKCVIFHHRITSLTFHILFTFHFMNWNRMGARKRKSEMVGEFSNVFYLNALKFSVCFLMYILLIYFFHQV